MSYFYDEGPREPFKGNSVWKLDGTQYYLTHYSNYLMLDFLARNETTMAARHQAEKELIICKRKLEFWKRHPNTVWADVVKGCEELKRQWSSSAAKTH